MTPSKNISNRTEIKAETKIRVGISMCLLGESVRYNGGHKKNDYVIDCLSPHFEWVPVCPEYEVGMGVPRESVHLEGEKSTPRMIGSKTGQDWTEPMLLFSKKKIAELKQQKICGFIFKKDSPSCGIERIKIYNQAGMPSAIGKGLFAQHFNATLPLIPVEDEGRLNDFKLRENFIECVFSYARLQKLLESPFSRNKVVDFHTTHKYLLLAHSPKHYYELGKLVAKIKEYQSSEQFLEEYSLLFIHALKIKASVKKHTNVLHHIFGFLKEKLTSQEKQSILEVIEDYRKEWIPLVAPLTLLKHYLQKYDVQYLLQQVYLNPHPKELMLRNHV